METESSHSYKRGKNETKLLDEEGQWRDHKRETRTY